MNSLQHKIINKDSNSSIQVPQFYKFSVKQHNKVWLTHIRILSQLHTLTWDITNCVYQNSCQKGYFNIILCVYVSIRWGIVWNAVSESHPSLTLSFCVSRAERRKRSASPKTPANDKLSLYGG